MSQRFSRNPRRLFGLTALSVAVLPALALAAPMVYTDTTGDQVGSTNKARDIWSASIDNDASNFIITINLDPGANLATSNFNFGVGITSGPGANGDTSANATTHGNPYHRTISIDSSLGGMTDWIGLFPDTANGAAGTATNPFTAYKFNEYTWSSTTSAWTAGPASTTSFPLAAQTGGTTASVISVVVPLADFPNLTLTPGSVINFDIYSTGTSAGQTAYDSLQFAGPTNSTNSATTQFNNTVLLSYTIQAVPEPGAFCAVLPALLLLGRARRR